jgi:phosphomannomutase
VAAEPLLRAIEAAFPGCAVSRTDGVKLDAGDGAWLVARISNTEPILRVVAESRSAAWVDDALGRVERLTRTP